jgi:hypothetical protein
MSADEEFWIPLVDEPIGQIVDEIYAGDPTLAELVGSPRSILAFRTFAYIRVGMLLGQLLVESDVQDHASDESWIEALLHDPRHRDAVVAAVRGVAEEVARESDGGPLSIGPGDEARQRFREFARSRLGS